MNTAFPSIAQTGSPKINPRKSLHLYAIFVACATFLLIVAGGLVTSTGSGLAVPDWPLSFGQFFPPMEGGVFYEHGHRMIAGTVGILTVILAALLWKVEPRRGVRYLGLSAVLAVCLQATLGGITVLYRLPVPVSVAHACLGQIFFCLIVSIAFLTRSSAELGREEKLTKLQRLGLMTLGFIFFQLIVGATLRHTGKALHVHFLGAFLVTVHIPLLVRRLFSERTLYPEMLKLAAALPVLLIAQLILGYFSWQTGPIPATTAHVGIGALLMAGSLLITLRAFQKPEAA